MHQVLYAHVITAPEPTPIGCSVAMRNVRMAEFVAILNIRRTMVVRVLTSTLNAVMKSLLFGSS